MARPHEFLTDGERERGGVGPTVLDVLHVLVMVKFDFDLLLMHRYLQLFVFHPHLLLMMVKQSS